MIGGYSVIVHGYNRSTGDMDVWVKPDAENYQRLQQAFLIFDMPVFEMTLEKFLDEQYDVFTFGRPPMSIDIMTSVRGLNFDQSFAVAQKHIFENVAVNVFHLNHLRAAKEASGRPKDIDDLLNFPT